MPSRRKLLTGLLGSTVFGRTAGVLADDFHVRIVDDGNAGPAVARNVMLTPVQARTMATSAASSYVSICQAFTINKRNMATAEEGLKRGRLEIAQLQDDRDKTLADFRAGYFCSKCEKSRTQIELAGENFQSHIVRVNGRIIPASAQQLAEKEAEYNGKLDKAYREQSTRQKNFDGMTKRQGDYEQQLQQGGSLWATAMRSERWLIEKQEEAARSEDSRREKIARDTIKRLDEALKTAVNIDEKTKARRDALVADQERWKQVLMGIGVAANRRQVEYADSIAQVSDRARQDRVAMREALNTVMPTGLMSVPEIHLSAPTEIGRVSVDITPDQAGANFQLGKVVSIGVEASFDQSAETSDVRAFMTAYGKARLYAGIRTDLVSGAQSQTAGVDGGEKAPNTGGGFSLSVPDPDSIKAPTPPVLSEKDGWKQGTPGSLKSYLPKLP